MRSFLTSNAGKGTLGVCLCCLILVDPIVGNWLVASFVLAFAVHHLREAFRKLDAERSAGPRDGIAVTAAEGRAEAPPYGMNTVPTVLETTPGSTWRNHR